MLFTNPGAQLKVLIDERQIQQRVRDLGEQISLDYQGKHLHLICILKGACVFLSDLIRHLPLDISIDFMAVSSYANSLHVRADRSEFPLGAAGGRHPESHAVSVRTGNREGRNDGVQAGLAGRDRDRMLGDDFL